jgi:hypothetical protein
LTVTFGSGYGRQGDALSSIRSRSIRILHEDSAARQEFDDQFLHGNYRRKVFVAKDSNLGRKSPPRRGRIPLTLVSIPVADNSLGSLIYENLQGKVETLTLEKGTYYYIPPNTPYQIVPRSVGVVELYYWRSEASHALDEETLPLDYFETHPSFGRPQSSASADIKP